MPYLHGEAFQEVEPVISPKITWHPSGRVWGVSSLDRVEKRNSCYKRESSILHQAQGCPLKSDLAREQQGWVQCLPQHSCGARRPTSRLGPYFPPCWRSDLLFYCSLMLTPEQLTRGSLRSSSLYLSILPLESGDLRCSYLCPAFTCVLGIQTWVRTLAQHVFYQ